MPAVITLRSGQRVDLMRPDPAVVRISDIAHSLSHLCRWGGHCREFYSVAEHSLCLSYHVSDPLWGLLHDATEAYLGDVVRPLKGKLHDYRLFESDWAEAVRVAFGLPLPPDDLRARDTALAVAEAGWLYGAEHAEWLAVRLGQGPLLTRRWARTPQMAAPAFVRHAFMVRYEELEVARRAAKGQAEGG